MEYSYFYDALNLLFIVPILIKFNAIKTDQSLCSSYLLKAF